MVEQTDNSPNEESKQRAPVKTPLYSALNADRYQRQLLIKTIQDITGHRLICYLASVEITRSDTVFFADLLHNLKDGDPVDLLLHTPGGDIDQAEKLIVLLRNKVTDDSTLNVIIPELAKSAGTLMAIGADSIIMSDTSELGTIDPQYSVKDAHGNESVHSVLTYLQAYDEHASSLRADPTDPVARAMLEKFDPVVQRKYRTVMERTRRLADGQMKKRVPGYTAVTSALMDINRFPSHNQMISHEDAKQFGLNVDYRSAHDPLWTIIWQLFCQYRLVLGDHSKVFESDYASHLV